MITPNELERLRAPFPLEAHTIREGYRPYDNALVWFVWVERPLVQDRLEEIFPGEWATEEPKICFSPKGGVSALVGIKIRDITRWDGGDDDTGEGVKSALTNGFRRAGAFGWHIARYCYDIDIELKTDDYLIPNPGGKPKKDWQKRKQLEKQAFDMFAAWYKRTVANAPKPAQTPVSSAPATPPVTPTVEHTQTPAKALETQPDAITNELFPDDYSHLIPEWNELKGNRLDGYKESRAFYLILGKLELFSNMHERDNSVKKHIPDKTKVTLAKAVYIMCHRHEDKTNDGNVTKVATEDFTKSAERAKLEATG